MERLSNKDFIAIGFKEFSYHTVGNSVSYNLGRRRYLSAVCIGQGNEALFLCEKSEVGNHYTDLVCIHNRDYDGFITLEKVKALIGWFGSGVAAVRDAQQAKIDEFKAQLCKAHERLELIQEEYAETETYLRGQIDQKNTKIASYEYLVKQDQIHMQSQQSRIVDLKAQLECCRKENAVLLGRVGELQGQLKTWKGQSMSAMIHGTCSCGEPWQRVISDREGFSLLHCFNCNNNRYENKEYFGDHEPKTLRGAND